jgi:xanthine dehydrogenase accessory factor
MNTNLSSLVSTFHELRQQHDQLVLATIIETLGSTYRKSGARMLITPDANFFGLLGGGCFEADLLVHAQQVFEQQKSKIVFYDMRAPEDEIWGLGLGCNGAVRILLQLIPSDSDKHAIDLIEQVLEEKNTQVLITVCESTHAEFTEGQNILINYQNDEPLNAPDNWPSQFSTSSLRAYQSKLSVLSEHDIDDSSVSLFCSAITPPHHLLIIGAGPDAEPVIRFAKELGWEISLVDYRESFLEQATFSVVDHRILATPENLADEIDLQTTDAIVVMTHKIEYDERYLKQLTQSTAQYIGLLGPAARRDRLLTSLEEAEEKLIRDRTFGPVGLDIGGELPEEIALSLVAQIQATLFNRDGGALHKKKTPLHENNNFSHDDLYAIVLAAGGAKRFGGLKQLLEYNGTSLLRRSIDIAKSLVDDRVKVILGARAQKVKRDIAYLDSGIIVNDNWESGIASSLKAGLDDLPNECSAVLYVLCDQALISAEHLQKLCELWLNDKSKIVACTYADTLGVPVIIPRQYFPSIMNLKGDVGAKSILKQHADNVVSINIPEAEIDIDTEADYMDLLSK